MFCQILTGCIFVIPSGAPNFNDLSLSEELVSTDFQVFKVAVFRSCMCPEARICSFRTKHS